MQYLLLDLTIQPGINQTQLNREVRIKEGLFRSLGRGRIKPPPWHLSAFQEYVFWKFLRNIGNPFEYQWQFLIFLLKACKEFVTPMSICPKHLFLLLAYNLYLSNHFIFHRKHVYFDFHVAPIICFWLLLLENIHPVGVNETCIAVFLHFANKFIQF